VPGFSAASCATAWSRPAAPRWPVWLRTVGAVEVQHGGAGPGRIRLNKVSDYSADSLHPFIAGNLAPGATAKTDGWSAYPGARSVKHDPHIVGKMAAHIILPRVHRVFFNLKVWALGVYHGLRRKLRGGWPAAMPSRERNAASR
jgi:hypothetical protein